jgi:hypothetical protein
MLEEAADELDGVESENSLSMAVGFAVTNEHGAILDTNDAGIGDGDLEDIGGEIFESGFTGGHRLGVDIPICLPDLGRDLIEEFALFHQIAELGAEDFGEGFDGEKEIESGGMPRAIGRTDSAPRNDVVNVGVVLQSSPPGVEYTEEAWEIAADVFGILGEFFDGMGRSLEQSEIAQALMLSYKRAQLLRDGKGDQKMMARELALYLFFEPLLSFVVLAGGAVAVATGNKELLRLVTAVTVIERNPASLSATSHDGIDDFAVGCGHGGSVA